MRQHLVFIHSEHLPYGVRILDMPGCQVDGYFWNLDNDVGVIRTCNVWRRKLDILMVHMRINQCMREIKSDAEFAVDLNWSMEVPMSYLI